MTFNRRFIRPEVFFLILFNACGGDSGPPANPCTPNTDAPTLSSPPSGANVMNVTVNGSLCNAGATNQYQNEPCTSVTICAPGTSTCQTITGILVDTGSSGLRIFSSLVTVISEPSAPGTIADCVGYGDGSSDWGPVGTVDVQLGSLTASNVPIHLIDQNFATAPGPCTSSQATPDTSPSEAGFNGILGVGPIRYDCGANCVGAGNVDNGQYYSCTGTTCTNTSATVAQQVQNPVALLPTSPTVYNNGIVLELPAISASDTCGAASATGSLVLGVGTQANNTPSGVTVYSADGSGNFPSVFGTYGSSSISAFVDSGSSLSLLPYPLSGFPDCNDTYGDVYAGFLCPGSNSSLSANVTGNSGSPTGTISFQVSNAYDLINSGNNVFFNLAAESGTGSNAFLDLGLPFFFGNTIVIGIDQMPATLGAANYNGPYYAF